MHATRLTGGAVAAIAGALPPDEQLAEIKKWFAAVAARYPDIDVLQVVNEGTWDPPDGPPVSARSRPASRATTRPARAPA